MINHIETLLTEHDCVILPGFGALIVNYVSAVIVEREEQLIPPHKTIYFNPALQHDDGLLIETWRLKQKISYQKASRQVEKFVLQIKQALLDHPTVSFGQLGTFHAVEHHRIEFQPAFTPHFLPDNIGLQTIKLLPVRKKAHHETQVVIHVPSMSKYVAAAVFMLLLMFVLPIGQFHTETNYARLNPWDYLKNQWMSQHFNITASDTNAVMLPSPSVMHPLTVPVASVLQKPNKTAPLHEWYIVVGTFHSEKQALISAKELGEKEKIALTVIKHHDLYRIVAQSFASRDSALTVLRMMRQKTAFNTAWIVYNPSSSSSHAAL
ncbi:MAG: SPOR domain-containing protein [Microbacter sp.]